MPRKYDPTRVRVAMLRKRVTQAQIARQLDIRDAAVWSVIEGKRTTARIQDAIAAAVGQPVTQLFPARRADVA